MSELRAAAGREPVGPSAVAVAESNVDPAEVAAFERLAATWWDPAGPFWPLHGLNALRARYLRERLATAFERDPSDPRPLAGLRLLDVGCGGGILSESMAALGADVHGIDVVARNVAIAATHARDSGLPVRYEVGTARDLLARAERYDVVLCMEVVEHVPRPAELLAECSRLLRTGGVMVVATINRTASSWLMAIVGAEYVLRWLPRGTHRWSRFVTPDEVEGALAAGGLEVRARTGVRVNPLTRRFGLTRGLAVNYMVVACRAGGSADMQAGVSP